jgi:branched-chain amino acid transport system ATP-binding protein
MSEILTIKEIHSHYGSSHVLQGVSFSLQKGIVAIVGRNGMGKTTLVKVIMGLLRATSGQVFFNGENVANKKPYYIASQGIGYVPQGRELFPSLSVHEHLQIVSNRKLKEIWNTEAIYNLFPNLRKQPNKSATYLSGGEQQMVAIGRALLLNPSLIIMDEPSEGLAPIMIKSLIETCKRLMSSGISILLIEQNLHVATTLAEELHIMVSGRIVQKIDSETIIHDTKIREKMLGVGISVNE